MSTTSEVAHAEALSGGTVSVWRVSVFRAAGFPAGWVLGLAAPESACAADELLEAEGELDRLRSELLAELQRKASEACGEERKRLNKALRRVRRGRVPDCAVRTECVESWRRQQAAVDERESRLEQTFARESAEVRRWLLELGGNEYLREALTWQNRRALREGVDKLRSRPIEATDSQTRQHELLLTSYLQRYCVKNDTIGFFGPVGYAELGREVEGIEVKRAEEPLAARNLYFEGWAIAALAARLGEKLDLSPWLRPRRLPLVGLHDQQALTPLSPTPIALSEVEVDLLSQCDGSRSARELAARLVASQEYDLEDEAAVFALLAELRHRGLLTWTLEVPQDFQANQALREILSDVEDSELRLPALRALDELDTAKDRVGSAVGDADSLDSALAGLEQSFARLTGSQATRAAGQMYAGRTLVFEDCRRSEEVTVGANILAALDPVVAGLMIAARWFTHQAASSYRSVFCALHNDIANTLGTRRVPFLPFGMAVQQHLRVRPSTRATAPDLLQPVIDDLHGRWAKVLELTAEGRRRLSYRSRELAPRIAETFDAPGPGWQLARYSSPDIMIAAESEAALKGGDFELVLAEFHLGTNSIVQQFSMAQHPDPEVFRRMVDSDHQAPIVGMAVPPDLYPYRVHPGCINKNGYRLVHMTELPARDRAQSIYAGDLVVEARGSSLAVVSLDGSLAFDVIEFLGVALSVSCVNFLNLMAPAPHRPRITIDNVIAQREGWKVAAGSLTFAREKNRRERFLRARAWAQRHGLPRYCFFRAPVEEKPIYLDFASPVYVELLCRAIRRSMDEDEGAALDLSEMVPAHGRMWFRDAQGEASTSELRIVALDHKLPPAPPW